MDGKERARAGGRLKEGQPCELEATFASDGIHLRDSERRCTPAYCGAGGTLDGASIPKKAGAKHG